jgi:hypothetical protein
MQIGSHTKGARHERTPKEKLEEKDGRLYTWAY